MILVVDGGLKLEIPKYVECKCSRAIVNAKGEKFTVNGDLILDDRLRKYRNCGYHYMTRAGTNCNLKLLIPLEQFEKNGGSRIVTNSEVA